LRVVLEMPEEHCWHDPPCLVSVEFVDPTACEPGRMADTKAFREEWGAVGEALFWDVEDREFHGCRIEVVGTLWWESTSSADYGIDYDCGFDVTERRIVP